MSRARVVLMFVVAIALVAPVPYSGEEGPRTSDGYECTSDWKGVAPLPMAAYEAVTNDEPPFRYGGEGGNWCLMDAGTGG